MSKSRLFLFLCLFIGLVAPLRAETIFATQVVVNGSTGNADNQLWRFDSATPGIVTTVAISGTVNPTERMIALDFRPSTGELYGLSAMTVTTNTDLHLYRINTSTGVASLVSASAQTVVGTLVSFGMDFNAADEVRIVSTNLNNLRLNPDTGALIAADTGLAFAAGDPTTGSPFVTAIASNASGTLFGIDSNTTHNVLVRIGDVNGTPVSPSSGVVHTIGSIGFDPAADFNVGFDISPATGVAFAALQAPNFNLYTVNLATGLMTSLGVIGSGTGALEGLAVAPASFGVPTLGEWGLAGLFAMLLLVGMLRVYSHRSSSPTTI